VQEAKLDSGLSEVARFLAQRAPFDMLAAPELGEVVAQAAIEFYPTGAVILSEDGGPVTFLRVIHSGGVDVSHDGRLLDLLGPGDTFGHAAMLSGLPPGFEARAAEDTLCYRIPVAAARPLLERGRSRELQINAQEPGHQAVAKLIRAPTVSAPPNESIGDVARRMTEAGATSAIVELADGELGIVTDRDLRTRVLAAGRPGSTPVREVMTTPVYAVDSGRLGGEVLYELLERGIRHAPVIAEQGRLVGVVEDADLFAIQPRSWFGVRRLIARAKDLKMLAGVAGDLPGLMLDLHTSSLRAPEIARVLSALMDALTCRALELAPGGEELPADGIVWVAVGAQARRELTMASRPGGVLICSQAPPVRWLASVTEAFRECSLVTPVLARVGAQWLGFAPEDELALAVLVDRRPLWGTPRDPLPVATGAAREQVLAALRARALAFSPPTGFDDGGVLTSDGRRSELLDIRLAAVAPLVELARWAGVAAGAEEGSTLDRLRAAGHAGVLREADALTLSDAFELALGLRIDHQMQQLVAGGPADDLLLTSAMSPLTRGHLRDVFRAITGVQQELRG
jgi:CBS domain-containing protein